MALRHCLQTCRRAQYLQKVAHCRWNSSLSSSDLGVRESLPPDHANLNAPQGNDPELSDQEWEIRTGILFACIYFDSESIGRAINVIKQTLPEFFSIGLVTSVDKATGEPRPSASIVTPASLPAVDDDAEHIYSPKIRLSYTPPDPLPAPFPKTFKAEGLSLYLMSSVFVRHTFNVLYTDVQVAMNRVAVNDPTTGLPYTPPSHFPAERAARKRREKSLFVGLTVHGKSRMTGTPGEWEV